MFNSIINHIASSHKINYFFTDAVKVNVVCNEQTPFFIHFTGNCVSSIIRVIQSINESSTSKKILMAFIAGMYISCQPKLRDQSLKGFKFRKQYTNRNSRLSLISLH